MQQTAMLESCPRLAGTALMQAIDRRVSAALSVELTHLEHGYLQQYSANYTAHNLHLDQSEVAHAPLITPLTIQSTWLA